MNGNSPDPGPHVDQSPIDASITRALSRKPTIAVPDTFAAQVTRQILTQPPARRFRWIGWGPRLALGSAALLTAGMFALAPHAAPSLRDIAFDGELLLLAELSALVLFTNRLLSRD